jgi:ABC-type Fe3+-hydroxamate transport system substrate-binding protein
VVRRSPDVIVASWCGKAVRPERIRSRTGWDAVPAVHRGQIYEIKSRSSFNPARRVDGWAAPAPSGDRCRSVVHALKTLRRRRPKPSR